MLNSLLSLKFLFVSCRIYEAGLNLLQNEDSDVRRETAGFVSQLPGQTRQSQYQDMYSSYALEVSNTVLNETHRNYTIP